MAAMSVMTSQADEQGAAQQEATNTSMSAYTRAPQEGDRDVEVEGLLGVRGNEGRLIGPGDRDQQRSQHVAVSAE